MSTTAGSAKKPNGFNEANESLYDPFVDLMSSQKMFMEVPWPEWSDTDLNAEVWEEAKTKSMTFAGPKTAFPISTSLSLFEDSEFIKLPPNIRSEVYTWKRPQEVFPGVDLTVFDPANDKFELKVPSSKANDDFLICFNELLPILQFYAQKYRFPVELETPVFVSNTQGEYWRPWHHIYSLSKAGKGQVHKPLLNPYGKYVLRLFYMGSWRKFTVDDKIPCDKFGDCMLPITQIAGELWPILLAKALLKVLSLTPTKNFTVIDFPFISFFTGWISGTITAVNKTCEQMWRRILVLTPSYEVRDEEAENKTVTLAVKDQSKKGSSKKESVKDPEAKNEPTTENFCFLLATLENVNTENFQSSYTLGISMTRQLPLIKANRREATKLWKRIRWIYWASEKGLWADELKQPPYRRLLCVTYEKQLSLLLAPDPQQEATIFDISVSEDVDSVELTPSDQNQEPEHWCDFFKLHKHLRNLNVLFKPSSLSSNFRITCIRNETVVKPTENPVVGKATAKAPPPLLPSQNVYFQSSLLLPCCNKPPILYFESITGIFLCFSLWVYPTSTKESTGYLDSDHPEILKISNASLIVERLDWRTVEQGEIIGILKTVGNSSIGLNLKPGRHILRLWVMSDCPYILDAYSDCELNVHSGSKIRFLMIEESEIILNYIRNVSNAFMALCLKFGKPDLSEALRAFYEAIKAGNKPSIGCFLKVDDFIETFLNCIMLSLKTLIFNVDELKIIMGALQSLFINPKIWCDLPKQGPLSSLFGTGKKVLRKVPLIVKERTLSEVLAYPWSPREIQKVIDIQRIYRGFRVRLLWKQQTPARVEFKPYIDRLKKVCDLIFVPQKRDVEVGRIIRKVVAINPKILNAFKIFEDIPNVIDMEEYTGKIVNVEPFAWIPIARFIVACHCDEPTPCAFYFSSNLEQFIIQGVDNDTNEELFCLTNSVSPHYYRSNAKGYTIFVFGWNEANVKTVNWRLEMVRMKHFQVIHLCNTLIGASCHPYTIPSLETSEIKNFYVPNRKSRICRCLLKIQKRTLLTLRLSTSYTEAIFILNLFLDKKFCSVESESSKISDKIIVNSQSSNGAILLSSVVLEYVEPNQWWGEGNSEDPTVYILEAYVINHSWPLTKQEWGIVEPLRVNGENWKDSVTSFQMKKGGSDSRKKLTRTSKRSLTEPKSVENPFWLLQVLNHSNEDTSDFIIVEEDKSYIESIKAMKFSWEEKDPGRRKRGKELRLKFLSEIYYEDNKNQRQNGEEIFGETDGEKEDEFREGLKSLLEKISSFSYLTNDRSVARFCKSPRILPKMPTYQLLSKYKKEKEISTKKSSVTLENLSEISSKLHRNMPDELEEDLKDFLNQCVHYRSVMADHQTEEYKLSSQLLEEAYEKRLKAVERLAR